MKKFSRTILGVTLLEVMLVLAIAAMIIVMSVRYYQSTNAANQANSAIAQITSIIAGADSLAQASGSYTGTVTTATVTTVVPTNGMTSPWGTAITITPISASSYSITIPGMPRDVCPLVRSKLTANVHMNSIAPTTCVAGGTTNMIVTYVANP